MFAISEEFGAYIFNTTTIRSGLHNDHSDDVVGKIDIFKHMHF